MRIVASFDPAAKTSGSFNAAFANNSGRIVVYNESNVSLQLQWGSFTTYCPAWTAMLYCIQTPNVNINWVQQAVLNAQNPPLSVVYVEAYDQSEAIVGTFPASLLRQVVSGNAVGVQSSYKSVGFSAVNNNAVVIGSGGGPQTVYLRHFVVTGDKAAAANAGQLHVTGLFDPSSQAFTDLYYFVNQGPQGTTIISEFFDPPLQTNASGAITFTFPNLSNGLALSVQYALQ